LLRKKNLVHTLPFITNEPTPWSRIRPVKLAVAHLDSKFCAFYETRRLIGVFIRSCLLDCEPVKCSQGREHTWGKWEMHAKFKSENLKEENYLGDLGLEGRMI
jgi:hypothetical protein